jgi:hypothetical protein
MSIIIAVDRVNTITGTKKVIAKRNRTTEWVDTTTKAATGESLKMP